MGVVKELQQWGKVTFTILSYSEKERDIYFKHNVKKKLKFQIIRDESNSGKHACTF